MNISIQPMFIYSNEYLERTNCYAYAFDIIDNPVTGKQFYTRDEVRRRYEELRIYDVFAAQPGLFSEQPYSYDSSIESGTEEGNQKLVELVKADARVMGLNFQEYKEGMSGGYAVLLVVKPGKDYHWYRQEADGTWSHKMGQTPVITGVENPIKDANERGYTSIVGYFYIKGVCDDD